jgi:hypothetical protein
MDEENLILYRLDQQAKTTADYRAETKADLAAYRQEVVTTNTHVFEQFKLIDGRLSSLEKWRFFVSGAVGVLVLLVGWVVTLKAGK